MEIEKVKTVKDAVACMPTKARKEFLKLWKYLDIEDSSFFCADEGDLANYFIAIREEIEDLREYKNTYEDKIQDAITILGGDIIEF